MRAPSFQLQQGIKRQQRLHSLSRKLSFDAPGVVADNDDQEAELKGDDDDTINASKCCELAEYLTNAANADVVPAETHRFDEVVRDRECQADVDRQRRRQPAGL